MKTLRYVQWHDGDLSLGHLKDYADYWTHGKTIAELEESLRDLCKEFTGGSVPGVRRVAELHDPRFLPDSSSDTIGAGSEALNVEALVN